MIKETYSLDDLIEKLKCKNIYFNSSDIERCKKLILRHNYLNFSSLKYLFSSGREKSYLENTVFKFNYTYKYITDYLILEKKYKQLLKLENKLRDSILMYEIELKTHFTFFLKNFFDNRDIDFYFFIENLYEYDNFSKKYFKVSSTLKEILEKEWIKQIENYNTTSLNYNKQYYLLIKVLTFGTITKFLNLHYNKEEKIYRLFQQYLKVKQFKLPKLLKDLNTLVILRNSLCHKESLIIFLEKGYKKNLKEQKRAKEQNYKINRNFLYERINAISLIYEYYMFIQNKRIKKLPENSWIKKYYQVRINNQGKKYFKKLKIEI